MPAQTHTVASVCPYCGVGCGLLLETDGSKVVRVVGDKNHPSNFGRLCTKGSTSAQALTHPGRMDAAYMRDRRDRQPVKTSMERAIAATAERLCGILERDGPDALGFYVSGQMSMESQYLINKLAKGQNEGGGKGRKTAFSKRCATAPQCANTRQ